MLPRRWESRSARWNNCWFAPAARCAGAWERSTVKEMMTAADFRDLLDGYGPDWSQWPDADRDAAQALLRDDAAALQSFVEAQALHRLLVGTFGAGSASADLHARLAAIPRQDPRPRAREWFAQWPGGLIRPWGFGVAAATLSVFLGLAIGMSTPPPVGDDAAWIDLASLAYGVDEDDGS